MKTKVWVVAGFVVASASGRADEYAGTPNAPCDRCEDLCRLVDVYLQREAGIQMWQQYAASTESFDRAPLPANINQLPDGIEDVVWSEFDAWTKVRRLPCTVAPGNGGGGMSTDLETHNNNCEITYNGSPLVGEALHNFETAINCKPLSDSIIEHEKVHQRHCKQAHATNPTGNTAVSILDAPANTAESELQAWTRHRDLLGEQIRKIVREHNCGWDPTEGQKGDPKAMPSLDQTRKMQESGWKAVDALSGGS